MKSRQLFKGKRAFVGAVAVPLALFYITFSWFPMLYSLVLSFTRLEGFALQAHFVGLSNYRDLIADPDMATALWNTLKFVVARMGLGIPFSFLLALLINSVPGKPQELFKTAYFMPVMTSAVAVATIWKWLYHPQFGFFNQILELLGLQPIPWLFSSRTALMSCVFMNIWHGSGFTTLIFLAGLKSIPSMYYEAARIDGANRWHLFSRITLPLIQPTLVYVLVVGLIGTFQVFDDVYLLTGGGPGNSTLLLGLLIYSTAFKWMRFGYGSAIAFVLFVIVLILTLIQLRTTRLHWSY